MKIYTDGSVLENKQASSRFVIPEFKTEKGFYLGKGRSIFTAELVALLMVLSSIVHLPMVLFNILFCVDSNAVLYSLNSTDSKMRSDIVYEIKHLVQCLLLKGIGITFCWIPSHFGLTFNEWADSAAERGVISNMQSTILDALLSSKKRRNIIENDMWNRSGFR